MASLRKKTIGIALAAFARPRPFSLLRRALPPTRETPSAM